MVGDSHQEAPLTTLPIEILIVISETLRIVDVLSLRQTCKRLESMTRHPGVWLTLVEHQINLLGIPAPPVPLDAFSTGQDTPEEFVRRAQQLRKNWVAEEPVHVRRYSITPLWQQPPSVQVRNLACRFHLRSTGTGLGKFLVSVTLVQGVVGMRYALQCWDLQTGLCVAHLKIATMSGLAFSQAPEEEDIAMISNRNGQLGISSVRLARGATSSPRSDTAIDTEDYGFDETLHPDENPIHLSGLTTVNKGKFICTVDYSPGDIRHFIVDTHNSTSPTTRVELRSVSLPIERSLASVIHHSIVLLLKPTRIELYDISILASDHLPPQHIDLLVHYRWRWPLDSLSYAIRTSACLSRSPYSPIDIIVRHSSTYPWPVNFLHRYTLQVNPDFEPNQPMSYSQEGNTFNLPYHFPPFNPDTFASPVRLFAQTASVVGRFGTVLWLDSATEDFYGPSGDGQRIAGLVVPHLYRYNDVEEIAQKQASSVFDRREHDAWVTLGLLEEYGIIAAGMKDGTVEVIWFDPSLRD